MKKIFFIILVASFISSSSVAQFIYKIKADSVKITNDSCNAELIIENSTKNVCGFLINKGLGRTEFRKALMKINDSIYVIGCDTLNINSGASSFLSKVWSLNGNGGTNPSVNFLGTTDNQDLVFRTNNSERIRINGLTGNLLLGSITDNGYRLDVSGKGIFSDTLLAPKYFNLPNNDLSGLHTSWTRYRFTVGNENSDEGIAILNASNAGSTRGVLLGHRSRGSLNSPTSVQNGDWLFGIVAGGTYNNLRSTPAAIEFIVDSTPYGTNNIPASINFLTGTNGGNRTSRLTVASNGKVKLSSLSGGGNVLALSDGTLVIGSDINAWQLTGNSGTNSANNFLGTTDSTDLVFRTNNNEKARLNGRGNFLIGTTNDDGYKLNVAGNFKTTTQTGSIHMGSSGNDLYVNQQTLNGGMALWRMGSTTDLFSLQMVSPNGTPYQQWPIHFHGPSGNVKISTFPGLGNATQTTTDIANTRLAVETHFNVQPTIDVFRAQILNQNSPVSNYGLNALVVKPSGNTLFGTNNDWYPQNRVQINGGLRVYDTLAGSIQIARNLDGVSNYSPVLQYNGINGYSFFLTNGFGGVPLRATQGGSIMIGAPVNAVNTSFIFDVYGTARIQTLPFLASRDTVLTYDPSTKQIMATKIVVSGSSGWQLTGNAGTNSGNFIGTTDNVSLRFKTNSTQQMILDSNGRLGIGTSIPAYTLDVNGTARVQTTPYVTNRDTVLSYDPSTKQIIATKPNIPGTLIGMRVLTSGTSYTPTSGTTAILIEMVGGGGGGGGVVAGSNTVLAVGAGGGSGSYLKKYIVSIGPGPFTYSIGTAGTAGSTTGGNGGNGSSTTFTINAVTYTAPGGTGGTGQSSAASTPAVTSGGAGGILSTNGDVNGAGSPGIQGLRLSGTVGASGAGGSSLFGGGGVGLTTFVNSNNASGYGSGGSGALSFGTGSTAKLGGTGAQGVIIIYEYK